MKKKRIAIIGAGYTGLVAAYRLAEAGYAVEIFERSDVVGGLASDFTIEGAPLERAYHHLFKTDQHILEFAKEVGADDKLEWHDSSVSIYYNHELHSFKGALDLIKFRPLSFISRVRTGLAVLYLQKTSNWEKLQTISAYDWMLKVAGSQSVRVIWEPLLKGKFDRYYKQVAMSWLWARLHIRAKSREKGGEKLGYFTGGFQAFTDAIISRLTATGVEIKTGVSLQSLSSEKGSPEITFSDGKKKRYDACLATTPSHVFAQLIAGDQAATQTYLKKLHAINYLGARLMVFSSPQDLSPYYWHNINDINLPFLVFINHTKFVDKSNYRNQNIYYIATYLPTDSSLYNCSDQELEREWFNGLRQIFPHFNPVKIREKYFFRFANAQHIVDTRYASKVPDHVTPLKNVFLANFSQIFPEDRGTNYAVRDGDAVAHLIMEKLR